METAELQKRVGSLYIYYLTEEITDENKIRTYMIEALENEGYEANLISKMFDKWLALKDQDISEEMKKDILESEKETYENYQVSNEDIRYILEDSIDKGEMFSIEKAFEYFWEILNNREYAEDDDFEDDEIFESYIKENYLFEEE